jgi:hypothetical protein
MKRELHVAAHFLVHLIRMTRQGVREHQLNKFKNCLMDTFQQQYQGHWFPKDPLKDSCYRCIRINKTLDPIIEQAGKTCGLSTKFLQNTFPKHFTMWINPSEVAYQYKENNPICRLYAKPMYMTNKTVIKICKKSKIITVKI